MRQLLFICALAAIIVAYPRVRTTQKQLHSTAARVQNIAPAEVDSADLSAGVNPEGIEMRGFNKRASDSKESFFITNKLSHRISSVRLLLRYTALDGSLLHERRVVVPVDLKSGQTQLVSIKSFDVQRTFYYYGSPKPRKSATPFKVAYRLTGYDIPVGD